MRTLPLRSSVAFSVALRAGLYRLEVALDGRALAGSPFPLPVRCDETAAGACKLFGVGLTHAVAGERTFFGIQGACASCESHPIEGREQQLVLEPASASSLVASRVYQDHMSSP